MNEKQQYRTLIIPHSHGERFCMVTDDIAYGADHLVIAHPFDKVIYNRHAAYPRSTKPLAELIRYINENSVKKAFVCAEDIAFLRDCPSLESIIIVPPHSAADFDVSPLYDMPDLKELTLYTVYGYRESLSVSVDYSRLPQLEAISADDAKGHINLAAQRCLKRLYLGKGQPASKTLADMELSQLEELTLCQSNLRSLAGLESARCLKMLTMSYCRSLEDISAIPSTVKLLEIEACGKIKDFSVLNSMTDMDNLTLFGSNTLPDLSFTKNMPQLKSLRFTMNVLDGDLTPCKHLQYAYCQNRKHYNLKDEDLPKCRENP